MWNGLHLACGVWRLVGGVCMAWTVMFAVYGFHA